MKTLLLLGALALPTFAYAQTTTTQTTTRDAPRVETRAQALRRLMTAAKLADLTTQNAVVDYIAAREKSRAELLRLARAAAQSLLEPETALDPAPGAEVDDDAVTPAFAAYRNALEADNIDNAELLEKLDKRVNFSGNPRLEAFLNLIGVLSDESATLGGVEAVFPAAQTAPVK